MRRKPGRQLVGEPKNSGFYTEDAAQLASAAARDRQAAKSVPRIRMPDGPIIFSHLDRPPLKPAPASNQNQSVATPPEVRKSGVLRRVAWLVLLPWYVAMLLASLGVIAVVARTAAHL